MHGHMDFLCAIAAAIDVVATTIIFATFRGINGLCSLRALYVFVREFMFLYLCCNNPQIGCIWIFMNKLI